MGFKHRRFIIMPSSSIKYANLSTNTYKDESKCEYKIYTSNRSRTPDYIFTDNAIGKLHELLPYEIEIETDGFDPNLLALYINCLLEEGYTINSKKVKSIERDVNGKIIERSVWGGALYFHITKENMDKLKREIKKELKNRKGRG